MSCTPSQTVGPFFHFALTVNTALGCIASSGAKGERINLQVRVFDGDGAPVSDGIVELWQADASGEYNAPGFLGFGRLATDAAGSCTFQTIRPGRVPDGRGGCQASHFNVSLFARGLLNRVCTRVYFEGDSAIAEDPVLALVPADRRPTLLARRDGAPVAWIFEIRLQGEGETVFFDI
jgi:protocatechuate 3,4-dioxygenase alpha subunit